MSPEFSGEDELVQENHAARAPRVLRDRAAVYIAEVVVRGFRGLGECHLHLEPGLTVIVGRNNAGKSRLLRAIAVALGALPADRDDWTVDCADEPTIDLVLAPMHGEQVDEEFDEQVGRRLRLDVSL